MWPIHLDKHLDKTSDIFWIKLLIGTFVSLVQWRHLAWKNSICHFGNLSEWAGMDGCALLVLALKNPSQEFKNYFRFGFLWIFRKIVRQGQKGPIILRVNLIKWKCDAHNKKDTKTITTYYYHMIKYQFKCQSVFLWNQL